MVGKYKVITLCGSTRFKDAFMDAQKKLTLEGNIVISVGLFGHSGDSEVWEGMSEDTLTQTKLMLDDMHKRKIDMADEIFVINVGGYIGMSTKSEIDYANATGKIVRYLEDNEQKWTSLYFRPGQTGSEGGIILKDEEYKQSCRITLEKFTMYYAITCGIYGAMVHTAFCSEEDHLSIYEQMKQELATFMERDTTEAEEDEFYHYFTNRY